MADNTDRFGLNTYSQGDTSWDHTDTVQTIDELAIERGTVADRPDSGDYDDELYLATDQQILYRWDADATDWIVEGVGSETDPLPKVWANEIDANSVSTEDLGITDAGTIFEQQAHIPCGWATAAENLDDVTSTDFVQAGSFIGGFDDTQRPDGATLYMRYDLRISLDDGETATVRLEGNPDSGASRITEEYQFSGTGSFVDRSSGWIEVTTSATGAPINIDRIEAKVSAGTLQFSSTMAHGCQFAWRVE